MTKKDLMLESIKNVEKEAKKQGFELVNIRDYGIDVMLFLRKKRERT